jgi:hypothetical protein
VGDDDPEYEFAKCVNMQCAILITNNITNAIITTTKYYEYYQYYWLY